MTDRDDEPQLVVPPKLRRQLRIADAGVAVCIAIAGAAFVWAAMHPGQVVPVPPPEVPPEPYWVPVPPIRDPRALGAAMAATFAAVLACYLDPAHPVVRWASRELDRPEPATPHGRLWGIIAPALRQSRLRLATLIAGVVGIALWHFGMDGIEGLRVSTPLLWTSGGVGFGFAFAFSGRFPFRLGLSVVSLLLAYQAAIGAAGWALDAVRDMP